MTTRCFRYFLLVGIFLFSLKIETSRVSSQEINPSINVRHLEAGHGSTVESFFKSFCIDCHGPQKSKGKITLHTLSDSDLVDGKNLELWETILEILQSGEMPPDNETQPTKKEREKMIVWINTGLRRFVENKDKQESPSTVRRLTNFEYQNTIRDLIGIDLNLIDDLPKDPFKPYHFNNTSEFMLLGPEQIDRYLEVARRVMASAIVDTQKPETYKTRREWDNNALGKGFGVVLNRNEIAIHNSRRGTPGQGMSVTKFPKTGEFRIRFQASAVFPNGATELPLRFVMGYNLNVNSSTLEVEPVGIVPLRNTPDNPQVYELRGRIENYPVQKGKVHRGRLRPDSLTITPQNNYDDGTLNDENRFLYWPRQLDMPRAVVDWIEFEAPITDVWPPDHHTRILFDSHLRQTNIDEYVQKVIKRFMSRAYRRPATAEEVSRFVKIYNLLQTEFESIEAIMRETLAMVLVTPQFLLHTKSNGKTISQAYEKASMLSYFLWGSMPDDELIQLASQGDLENPIIIKNQVNRMLDDARSHDFISNFTKQWLSLEKIKTVPINRDLFPRFLFYVEAGERAGTEKPYIPTIRDHMINETIHFFEELINRDAPVYNLVDSDFAMMNQPLAAHYGVDGVEGQTIRPVDVGPEKHLGGLLTQGSILIGNSTGSAPHPIYRAVWLREAILGDEVKDPPAEVPALSDSAGESADEASNIKDLLAKHRTEESCHDCHIRLDPWGIPFERYNAIGKFQPFVPEEGTRVRGFNKEKDKNLVGYERYLKKINTKKVQASARVPQGPEIDGMRELKEHLITDRIDDIAENLIRKLLSYAIGRELNYQDRFEVEKILSQSKEKGYLIKSMIVSICQSDLVLGQNTNEKKILAPQ